MPLFRVAGTTGSAIKVDVKGKRPRLRYAKTATGLSMSPLGQTFGPGKEFNTSAAQLLRSLIEELRIVPNDERLRELGMTRTDLGLAVQAAGEGILLFRDYREKRRAEGHENHQRRERSEKALPFEALPLNSHRHSRTASSRRPQLPRLLSKKPSGPGRSATSTGSAAVTLEVTAPTRHGPRSTQSRKSTGIITAQREASGAIAPGVQVQIAGSSDALGEIKEALLGDWLLRRASSPAVSSSPSSSSTS